MKDSCKNKLFVLSISMVLGLVTLFSFASCKAMPQLEGELFKDSPTVYNNDMAILCSEFSEKIERDNDADIRNIYDACGIKNTITDHFTGFLSTEGGAYAIGNKTVNINGVSTEVIVITARGTQSFGEIVGDFFKGSPENDLGIWIYGNINDYEKILWNSLNYFLDHNPHLKSSNSLKFIINGHSLGGAAANYLAAKITSDARNKSFVNKNLSQDDIYAYTFGAIKVIIDSYGDQNITDGYENIHNLYNWDDSYGPYGSQQDKRVSAIKQKFGHTETFSNKKEENYWTFWDVPSHGMPTYQEALLNINDPKFGFEFHCKKQDASPVNPKNNQTDKTPQQTDTSKQDKTNQNSTSWLIGKWKTVDGWIFNFQNNSVFTLDMGFGSTENGTYSLGLPTGNTYPIMLNGTSLLSFMKLMYGSVDKNYRFEILKESDSHIYLVQVYGSYTATTSPCKLPLTKI